jgi:hypothetical protein
MRHSFGLRQSGFTLTTLAALLGKMMGKQR